MKTVTSVFARAHFSELLQKAGQGERVIIERHKRPIAELRPINTAEEPVPKLGTGKGKVKIFDPNWAAPMTDAEVDEFYGFNTGSGKEEEACAPCLTRRSS